MFKKFKKINKVKIFFQLLALDFIIMSQANATDNSSLQQATGGSKSANDVITNINGTMNTIVNLITLFFGLVGLMMVANSLVNLYKASKDSSHQTKPLSGGIGLVIGGLLLAVGTVAGISKNTLVGN
jgi:hypothetical protein